jgi:Arc/MetJ-type ribon-helix-helix transcriptional regulator
MGAAEKISISLGAEDLRWARRQAKKAGQSLSSVIAEGLRRQRQAEARERLLAELGTADISELERNAVRDEWRLPKARPRRKAKHKNPR